MRDRRNPVLALLTTTLAVAACVAPAAADAAGPRGGYVTTVLGGSLATFDAFTGVVDAPIALGGRPWGVAITPDGATAYVSDEQNHTVTPVDTATSTPGTPIPVGDAPRVIGITPDGVTAYVANLFSGNVTPIDTATNTAGSPIAVGAGPHGIAIAPDGSRVYVSNVYSGDVSVVDTATNAVTTTIPAGVAPYTIAITPNGDTVYVADLASDDAIAIDTATNTATSIPIGGSTYGVAVAPDGDTAYVSEYSTPSIVPIDTSTHTAGPPIPIGSQPEGLAITPDGSTAYVTDVGNDTFRSVDLATDTAGPPNPTGQAPMTIAITPDQAPTAAFDASVHDLAATFDASNSSDSDGTVAGYSWDFGDGQTATGSQPTVNHDYAQPGAYTATLTVTDDEGCSAETIFTGQTASCSGSSSARATHTVEITGTVPTASAARQAIERFTLDGPCVRRARDGKARVGLRLVLAQRGTVAIQVDRAVAIKTAKRCPKPRSGRRYSGKLRRVEAVANVDTQAVAASVRRRVTRSFDLRPGLYRIAVRAHDGDSLTRAAYRWVRVLR
jgi:YVTN family beta-propeller protein